MPLVKFQADDKLAEKVMDLTGYRVASKAFAYAAERCLRLEADLKHSRAEIEELRRQVLSYQQTLSAARDAAIQLAEVAGQGDFFQAKQSRPVEPDLSPRADESMDHFLARINRAGRK